MTNVRVLLLVVFAFIVLAVTLAGDGGLIVAGAIAMIGLGSLALYLSKDMDRFIKNTLEAPGRIQALDRATDIVFPPDDYFNMVCDQVKETLGTPISFVTFVFPDTQIFKGLSGEAGGEITISTEIPTQDTICRLVAGRAARLEVKDARKMRYIKDCASVRGEQVRAYIGEPVMFKGYAMGALAATDIVTRDWTEADRNFLDNQARRIERELEDRNHAYSR